MIAAMPMQNQSDLVACDRSDNLDENGAQNALARLHTRRWIVPGLFKVCSQGQLARTLPFVDRRSPLRGKLIKLRFELLNSDEPLVPAALQLSSDVPVFRFHRIVLSLRSTCLVAGLLERELDLSSPVVCLTVVRCKGVKRRRHSERLQ